MMKTIFALLLLVAVASCSTDSAKRCTGDCIQFDGLARMNQVMPLKELEREVCVLESRCPTQKERVSDVPCVNGMAGEYPCDGMDLKAFVPLSELGSSGEGNDIWGWTDPETNGEWAIMCCTDGTSFVNVTNPTDPRVVAWLPTETVSSIWRDVKVYKDHAFIVSEAVNHGMQIVDLRTLKFQPALLGPVTISNTAFYSEFGSSHNIVINEETGFAYSVGTKTCNAGLHVVDISDPVNPTFAGCYALDGYTHDAQCVIYNGPDLAYRGREICWAYNEDTVTVVDVTDKENMYMLSKIDYADNDYTHQGWLTKDQRYAFSNDELDESYGSLPGHEHTRTLIWDYKSLENPVLVGAFHSEEEAIDHNLYIKGDLVYESNYCAGLRVLDCSDVNDVHEVAYFDCDPECSRVYFGGTWSNYPYFESGNIIVSSIERGLYIVAHSD